MSDEIKLDGNKKSRMGQVKNYRNITERREQSYESKWERSKEIWSYIDCKCKLDEIKLDETIAWHSDKKMKDRCGYFKDKKDDKEFIVSNENKKQAYHKESKKLIMQEKRKRKSKRSHDILTN